MIRFYYNGSLAACQNNSFFEFPHFAIHRAKRFPSLCDGSTLHIKAPWKASFPDTFCARCLCCQGQQSLLANNIGYYKKWGNSKIPFIWHMLTIHLSTFPSYTVGITQIGGSIWQYHLLQSLAATCGSAMPQIGRAHV